MPKPNPITIGGKDYPSINAAARDLGVTAQQLRYRLSQGWEGAALKQSSQRHKSAKSPAERKRAKGDALYKSTMSYIDKFC